MSTRTFEVTYFVGSLPGHYTARVHADDGLAASAKIAKLVTNFKRVWETIEIAQPVAGGGLSSVDVGDADDRAVIWTGNSDVEVSAGPGHNGQSAQVTIAESGEVRIDMLTAGVDGAFAPLSYAEEALALRACVRSLAAQLVSEEEVIDGFRVSADAHAALARTAPTWRDVELEIVGGRRISGQAREVEYLGLPALEVREDRAADREPVTYMRAAVFSMRMLTAAESAERATEKAALERRQKLQRLVLRAVIAKPLTVAEVRAAVEAVEPGVDDFEFEQAFDSAPIERIEEDPKRWTPSIPF